MEDESPRAEIILCPQGPIFMSITDLFSQMQQHRQALLSLRVVPEAEKLQEQVSFGCGFP